MTGNHSCHFSLSHVSNHLIYLSQDSVNFVSKSLHLRINCFWKASLSILTGQRRMFVKPLVFNSLDTVCTQRVFTESAQSKTSQ